MNEKLVKIEIITGGRSENTRILIDGVEWTVEEFRFSMSIPRRLHGRMHGGSAILQAQRVINGTVVPVQVAKDGFEKLAEATERNKENDNG